MTEIRPAVLRFAPEDIMIGSDAATDLRTDLSAAAFADDDGRTLFAGCDESVRIERLTLLDENTYGRHQSFALRDCLPFMPAPENEEVDVEGMDADGGYLWVVGSHSLRRRRPRPGEESAEQSRARLADVTSDGNRYLLARIPLDREPDGTPRPARQAESGARLLTAARLRGHYEGNELTTALKKDEHLGPFLSIPGKDNGFDIEGLAVTGNRIFLGLRGPVLRGWALLLEVEVEPIRTDPTLLTLRPIGPNQEPYIKHFLDLGGLGIRDLCRRGDDLLILAGPTMDLDGPVRVFRWKSGATAHDGSLLVYAPSDLSIVVPDVPFGEGEDHAEGIALLPADDKKTLSLLLLYDSPATTRLSDGASGTKDVTADIITAETGMS